MKGSRGRGRRCCHRRRLGSELLSAAVVIATAGSVVGAAVAGRMLLRLLLLLLLVVRWAGSQSLASIGSTTSAVAISVSTPPQMRTKIKIILLITTAKEKTISRRI